MFGRHVHVADEEGWAMAQVKVVVNGRTFRMGCKDGEEMRVQSLAAEIDGHVQNIKNGSKAVQDERLFLMAALLMADQLWEAREEIQRLQRMALDPRGYQVIDGGVQAMQRDLGKAMDAGSAMPRAKGTA
jgi:cell division protein ZapA